MQNEIRKIANKQQELTEIEKQLREILAVEKECLEWEKKVGERCGSVEEFQKQRATISQIEKLIRKYGTIEK